MGDVEDGAVSQTHRTRRIRVDLLKVLQFTPQLFGRRTGDTVTIFALLAYDTDGVVEVCSTQVRPVARGGVFELPSVTALWPAAQAFEREIAEQFGVRPTGHPWLKPLRYHGTDDGAPDVGQVVVAIDPSIAADDGALDRLEHEFTALAAQDGVRLPGDRRRACRAEAEANGVEVPDDLLAVLKAYARGER